MATVNSVINRAMRLIGVIGDGEVPSASEAQDALSALNSMVDAWAAEKLTLHKFDTVSYAPTTASFTVGPTGNLVTARPVEILSAYRRVSGLDTPVDVVDRAKYETLPLKSQGGLVEGIYYKPTYPNGTVFCWPVPAGETLFMSVQQALTAFTGITQEIELPPGYLDALAFNLAVHIAPEYEVDATATVQRMAQNSKRLIKTVNLEVPSLSIDPAMSGHASGAQWWTPPQ